MHDSSEAVSRNFTLREFAVSASHPDLVRPVPVTLVPKVRRLASQLQIVRDAIDRPMRILSGYRPHPLNVACGGSSTSQHVHAEASDFTCDEIEAVWLTVLELIRDGKLPEIGQCIYYPAQRFIHMALKSGRFPVATACVHWPARKLKYRVIQPTRAAFLAVAGGSAGVRA